MMDKPLDTQEAEAIYASAGKWNLPFLERNAEILMSSGEYELAKNIWKTILKSGEKIGKALYGLAYCLNMEKRFDEACHCLEESIAYQPTADAYRLWSKVLIRMGKEESAVEVMERALYLKSLHPEERYEYHFASGNCLSRLGRFETAENHYKKALSIHPTAGEVQSNLGTLYARNGKWDLAERSYRDAIASGSDSAAAGYGLGLVYTAQGRIRDAYQAFVQSLKANLNQPFAIVHLLECAHQTEQFEEVEKILSTYSQSSTFHPSLLYHLAWIQIRMGMRAQSEATLSQLVQIQPNHEGAKDLLRRVKEDSWQQSTQKSGPS